ncbi:MAG: toll/interleukin-1 receptor domain-containing protein [Hyphomonadaceae bacterium]|nr:toll/interleukin-1 receptor domain-containing protein [Hyphomonadaceae bacterium]
MKYDIFVSYRRSDRELVASVVRRLEARGVGVWYDADIDGGADWRETIVEALTNSDMLAIFFSEDCNNSRQLKKELAVADSLGKPVVPILIENTQPRGAYLYELADRNWIQIWPEPMDRIDELVEHLATLAGKSSGGLEGGAADAKAAASAKRAKVAPPAANDGIPAPAANDDLAPREAEQPLTEAVEDFITSADGASRPAPKIAKAYVGSASNPGKPIRKLNDILPFKWIDLVVLVPVFIAVGVFFWLQFQRNSATEFELPAHVIAAAMFMVGGAAVYGAVVFPIRYYLRRRSLWAALGKYLVSTLLMLAVVIGLFYVGVGAGAYQPSEFEAMFAIFGTGWLIATIVAFVIYGALAGQRAIRSFRSNIRKL